MGPEANDAAKNRIQERVQSAATQGTPTIPEIPVWKNAELLEYEQSVLAENGNVNQSFYQTYFDTILTSGNLKGEEVRYTSALYEELCTVLRQVVSNPDADVAELMKNANTNWQRMMDFEPK